MQQVSSIQNRLRGTPKQLSDVPPIVHRARATTQNPAMRDAIISLTGYISGLLSEHADDGNVLIGCGLVKNKSGQLVASLRFDFDGSPERLDIAVAPIGESYQPPFSLFNISLNAGAK